MTDDSVIVGDICPNAEMHLVIDLLRLGPLLQFHDDDAILVFRISADNDEVHALRCLGDVVFDGNLDVVIDLGIVDDVAHEIH